LSTTAAHLPLLSPELLLLVLCLCVLQARLPNSLSSLPSVATVDCSLQRILHYCHSSLMDALLLLLLGWILCRRRRFKCPPIQAAEGMMPPYCVYFTTFSLVDALPPCCSSRYFTAIVSSLLGGCFATVASSHLLAALH
jgi:hypothetical protein